MGSSVRADTIRGQVRHIFQQHGVTEEAEMCESLLIRGGLFCGRRFELDGLSAIWFVEENELKVYDRGGKVLETENLASPQRRNAA